MKSVKQMLVIFLLTLVLPLFACGSQSGETVSSDEDSPATPVTLALNSETLSAGDIVDVLFDSEYYVSCDFNILKSELFSFQDEIYAPLQGLFEAKRMTFKWGEDAQAVTVTVAFPDEITPQLEELAEHWAYPKQERRGYHVPDYVHLIDFVDFDINTKNLICKGLAETYSFRLSEDEQKLYMDMINQGLGTSDLYRLVYYQPAPPPAGGPPSPHEIAPFFVDLANPYSEIRQAIVRPITIVFDNGVNYEDGEIPTHMLIDAIEYDGDLYISVPAICNIESWFGYGSIYDL